VVAAALDPGSAPVGLLYIVSFSLFIYGIRLGTHPTTARRGNGIAAPCRTPFFPQGRFLHIPLAGRRDGANGYI
jgi:hypothetical protein